MVNIKKKNILKIAKIASLVSHVGQNVEKLEALCTTSGNVKLCNLFENNLRILKICTEETQCSSVVENAQA